MATRASLRTALRVRLEDSSGSPLFADSDLNEALVEALRVYGQRFPQQQSSSVSIVIGTTSYALPAGCDPASVVELLDAQGDVVPRRATALPGWGPSNASGYEQEWSAWGTNLLLTRQPTAAETWTLRWLGGRELTVDDVSSQPIVAGDEPLILALAAAWALERRNVEDGKRGNKPLLGRAAEEARREANALSKARRKRARGGWLA